MYGAIDSTLPQQGGMKIIAKNTKGEDVAIRKVADTRDFINIFSSAISVDTVSVDSLTGFILRITLPVENTPFRSDIFNERGELMNADEYELPSTGQLVTQHILKCCIVQPQKEPRVAEYTAGRGKSTCTRSELRDEYDAQSNVYSATMAYAGIPVCPDVYAIMFFNLTQFRECFFPNTLSPRHVSTLPSIQTDIFNRNRVFQYLLQQLEAPLPPTTTSGSPFERKVGIILMESLAPSYSSFKQLRAEIAPYNNAVIAPPADIMNKQALLYQLCERSLAVCVIIFYRIGYIPLDAHSGNWMYDITQPVDQFRIRAIDFGRVVSRMTPEGIQKIQAYIANYIRSFVDAGEKRDIIRGFFRLLGIDPALATSAYNCAIRLSEIISSLNKLIRRNLNGSILWNPTGPIIPIVVGPVGVNPVRIVHIDSCMILNHKNIFIIVLIDSCFNTISFANHHFCQLGGSIFTLFGNNGDNLRRMIRNNIYIDLQSYLNSIPDHRERAHVIRVYTRIRDYIGGYLRISPQRGLFLDPFYEDASPDTPEDPAVVAARPPPPPPPPPPDRPPPLPSLLRHSPRKSPRKLATLPSFKDIHSLTSDQYDAFISGHIVTARGKPAHGGTNHNKAPTKNKRIIKSKRGATKSKRIGIKHKTKYSKLRRTIKNKK
jgi:hypothetical protein